MLKALRNSVKSSLFSALLLLFCLSVSADNNEHIAQLEPVRVWTHFAKLLDTPRPSHKEEKVAALLVDFARHHQLSAVIDKSGNVIIKKPATKGMEACPAVILQSHMDIVTISEPGVKHDFDKDPINAYLSAGFVRARGTTLGADNGIGVAYCMALLESTDIPHPALECLFTTDEEDGMSGAQDLEEGLLAGRILINLDSELEQYLVTGSAGIKVIESKNDYDLTDVPEKYVAYRVAINGFSGGHSADIHKDYGCANVILMRFLASVSREHPLHLTSVRAGERMNALAAAGEAELVIPVQHIADLQKRVEEEQMWLQHQFKLVDVEDHAAITVVMTKVFLPEQVLSVDDTKHLLSTVTASRHGVIRHSDGEIYPYTSCNLGIVSLQQGQVSTTHMLRSCFESDKSKYAAELMSHFSLAGWDSSTTQDTPVWEPVEKSTIQPLLAASYFEELGFKPTILIEHGGLEPAVLGDKLPGVEMISLGPDIFDAHSPNERVNVESVGRIWRVLVRTLANIPASQNQI